MMITKLLAVAALASAVVVRDAAEFRAELARGAPSIELADNLYLEGEELNVTAPCVVDGRGYVLHNDARHFRASASLDLRNVTLVRAGYAPTPSPTCAPTPLAEEPYDPADALELVDIFNAGIGTTCDDTNKRPARSVAGGGALAVDLAGDGCKFTRVLDADGAGVAALPLLAQKLYAEDSGAVLVQGKEAVQIVAPDGSASPPSDDGANGTASSASLRSSSSSTNIEGGAVECGSTGLVRAHTRSEPMLLAFETH